jgi:RNA polymerase sigma factor (sigma-70 family)
MIVDDKELFREGLRKVLTRQTDIEIVGDAPDGRRAVDMVRQIKPDVVLMDVMMPVMDGVEAARRICTQFPKTQVVMLTVSENEQNLYEAIKAGARGYIHKDTSVDDVTQAIRRAHEGQAMVTPFLASKLLDEFAHMARSRDEEKEAEHEAATRVTEREREVLQLLVKGATNRDIAEALVITENTVKVHLRNILEKLQLRNRQQAAAYAIKAGLVDHVPGVDEN